MIKWGAENSRRAQWLVWNTGSCCKSPHCTARSCWEFYFRAGKCEIWNVKVKLWHFHIHPRLHPISSFEKAYLCSFLEIKCSFIIHSALLQGPCAEWVYICRKLFFESTFSTFLFQYWFKFFARYINILHNPTLAGSLKGSSFTLWMYNVYGLLCLSQMSLTVVLNTAAHFLKCRFTGG